MRLVIESDDGAAWYVMEELEAIDLSTEEGKDILVKMVSDTVSQVKTELEDYTKIAEETDNLPDNLNEGEAEYVCEDLLINPIETEIRLSDLDEADIFNDEESDPRKHEAGDDDLDA